jgi:mannosyltransferase
MNKIKFYLTEYRTLVTLAAITLVGTVLRLIYIGGIQPYMGDEVLSLAISRHFSSIGALIRYLGDVEFHPPLFYILVRTWVHWFGENPYVVHILPTIFGIACIPLTYWLSQTLFANRKVSLLAGFFVAILPIQLEYSQSARPYTIMCFLALLSFITIWKYFETRNWHYLIGYAIAATLGLYTHYSFLLVLSATVTWSFYQVIADRDHFSRQFTIWLTAHAAIVLGFAFWLKNFLYKLVLSEVTLYGYPRSFINARPQIFYEQMFNQLFWLQKALNLTQLNIFVVLIGKLVLLAAVVYGIKTQLSKREHSQALVFLFWISVVPFAAFIFMPFSYAYYEVIAEHLIFITMPLLILACFYITKIENVRLFRLALIIIVLSLVPSISSTLDNDGLNDGNYQFQALGRFINDQYQPGDLILIPAPFTRVDLQYYLKPGIPIAALNPIPYFGGDFYQSPDTLGFFENEAQTRIFTVNEGAIGYKLQMINHIYKPKRVWLVYFENSDYYVHSFFINSGWHRKYSSFANFFLLDLYDKP